jgi:hypothetical protein
MPSLKSTCSKGGGEDKPVFYESRPPKAIFGLKWA